METDTERQRKKERKRERKMDQKIPLFLKMVSRKCTISEKGVLES